MTLSGMKFFSQDEVYIEAHVLWVDVSRILENYIGCLKNIVRPQVCSLNQ